MQNTLVAAGQRAEKVRHLRRGVSPLDALIMLLLILVIVAVLLPSLMKAREQAKAVKCIVNLKQIATSVHMYFNDGNDWFPWEKDNHRPAPRLHAAYYGGHPGRKITPPDHWWGYIEPELRDTPGGRPFNMYLYPGMPKHDIPASDPNFETVRRMPIFECPSDTGGGRDHGLRPFSERTANSLYYEQGTSYVENYLFSLQWALANIPAKNSSDRWQHFSNAFIKRQLTAEAGLLIMLYEDPFDYALRNQVARPGWHGKPNRHNLAFLDGHAAMVETQTDKLLRGPNWKSCGAADLGKAKSKPWWENSDDPDYKFRKIPPLPDDEDD